MNVKKNEKHLSTLIYHRQYYFMGAFIIALHYYTTTITWRKQEVRHILEINYLNIQ